MTSFEVSKATSPAIELPLYRVKALFATLTATYFHQLRKILIMPSFKISVLLVVFLLTSCSLKTSMSQPQPPHKTPEIIQVSDEDESNWQEYVNQRFGFSIKFPKSWPRNQESTNSDGIFLYSGDSNIDIRAYGSYANPFTEPYGGFLSDPSLKRQEITLNSGRKATLFTGKEADTIVYIVVLEQGGVFYQLNARVTQQFFQENEKTLLKVAKSLNIVPIK